MDGLTVLGTAAGVNGIALIVVIFAVKKIVTTACDGIKDALETERGDRIRVDNELWEVVNSHGHKGLSGNNARVTR